MAALLDDLHKNMLASIISSTDSKFFLWRLSSYSMAKASIVCAFRLGLTSFTDGVWSVFRWQKLEE